MCFVCLFVGVFVCLFVCLFLFVVFASESVDFEPPRYSKLIKPTGGFNMLYSGNLKFIQLDVTFYESTCFKVYYSQGLCPVKKKNSS